MVPFNPSILVVIGSDYVDLSNLKEIVEIRAVGFADLFTHRFQLLNHAGQFTRVIRVSGVSGVLQSHCALPAVAAVVTAA